jgi:glycosyltransferase involved in cell wall biosynthesis
MAAGLPVVATPVGAIPDAVRDGEEGLLVPVRDPAALTAALRRLIEDRELRLAMGARARARAESVFSMEAVTAQLESLYRSLLAPGRG